MAYIRIRTNPILVAPADFFFAEDDVWPSRQGKPFVLVTHKAWRPPTDIYETPAEVVIKMEVAGINEDQLQITIDGDLLTIRGQRRDETVPRKIGYHHMGISYGEFASDISLPGPIDQSQVTAEYQAGFLTVTLPKAQPRKSNSVRIAVTEPLTGATRPTSQARQEVETENDK